MSARKETRSSASMAALSRHPRGTRRGGAGGTLLGVFIGVVLGLAIAAAAAFYLMRGNPYQPGATAAREPARDSVARSAKPGEKDTGKPRFDFYKILPGAEEPKVQAKAPERSSDRATVDRTLAPREEATVSKAGPSTTEPRSADRFWLQAGSFTEQGDAENLKARLALAGWEASVQEADVPDKGVRYRVRMGPYDNTDELSRMKTELSKRGFDVAVIKY